MKTIAIIPARGNSKRFPEKNTFGFGGMPLLAHSIAYAMANANTIDAVYVSTDNAKIKEVALQYGAKVIDRPANLSGDFEPTISALKHTLTVLDDTEIEHVVLLQPTNPLRPQTLLSDCFAVYIKENCESLFTVTQSHKKLGKITTNQFVPFNYQIGQRNQDIEPLFFENGLLYITKAKSILENKIITPDAYPYLVNHIFAHIDIDTKADLDYAHYVLTHQ